MYIVRREPVLNDDESAWIGARVARGLAISGLLRSGVRSLTNAIEKKR